MVHAKPALPSGHGELLIRPPFETWADLAAANRISAGAWRFLVGGRDYASLRAEARTEAVLAAEAYCARLGIPHASADPGGIIVATGHQPELYHPGVWAKVFLLERLARVVGGSAVDLVVDTDGFDRVGVVAPCFGGPKVERCHSDLAKGGDDSCYACTPAPDERAIADFTAETAAMLSTVPAVSVSRHFADFAEQLAAVAGSVGNLAELVTAARRRYEEPVASDYLELPVSEMSASASFLTFVAGIVFDARRFAAAYNDELAAYREVRGIRTKAQPVPDLEVDRASAELPFWVLRDEHRSTLSVDLEHGVTLVAGDARVHLTSLAGAVDAIRAGGLRIAPKALPLTMFARMFLADLFIHGVGGGGYDQVTDGIIRRYFGVDPPRYVVASLTMFLPLGGHLVTEAELRASTEQVNRFEHNPDALIGDVDFDSAEERDGALALAREKSELIGAMQAPDADKKRLGGRIREINAELRELLAPLGEALAAEKRSLDSQKSATQILTDRSYPFCFWSPFEVADQVGYSTAVR